MGKRFVTIFPICEDVHLTKDLGQIPYFLHKLHGFDSKIVCYKNSKQYTNIDHEVKGLKIDFIENKGRISFLEKSVLTYIYKNAKNIDILNLYIFSKFSFVYGLLYKFLNPKGCLFLKLDGYNETFAEGNNIIHSTKTIKNYFLKLLEKKFLKKVDLITIENSDGETLVKKMYPSVSSKIMYLPVGVNNLYLHDNFNDKTRNFKEKENIILTVGRIGEPIKNHEMIIKAIIKTDMKDWKMVFVGPINDDFKIYFDKLCTENPLLKEKVIITGNLSNRIDLYEWYNRSKVFCMTSHKESFCHSISEALYFGNYIVGTEGIMSMKDITDNGKFGVTLKDDDEIALAAIFQKIINNENEIAGLYNNIIDHSRKKFIWSEIITGLYQRLENKIPNA